MDKIWTIQEIAQHLEVSSNHIQQIIKGKYPLIKLNATKVGRQWLVNDQDAQEFFKKFKTPDYLTPQQIADELQKSRKWVVNQLTGYGGKREPTLLGEKVGNRWIVPVNEANAFIDRLKNGS